MGAGVKKQDFMVVVGRGSRMRWEGQPLTEMEVDGRTPRPATKVGPRVPRQKKTAEKG